MRPLLLVAALAAAASAEEKLDDAEAEMKKADEYAAQKDWVPALAHYNAARMIAPDRPGPYLQLGLTYSKTGDCWRAVVNLERYVKLKGADARPEAKSALDACRAQLPACAEGMVRSTETAGRCCWPGQTFEPASNRCAGEPTCPAGFVLGPKRLGCKPGAADHPAALSKQQIATAMRAAQPIWKGCHQQYRDRGTAEATFVVNGNGTVQSVRLDGPLARTTLGTCLEDALRSAVFPQFKGPTMTVRWPFSFK